VLKVLPYEAYRDWCSGNGVYPEIKKRFGEKMAEKDSDPDQQERVNGKKQRVWRGLGLKAK
jgi:phage/plasmid-associated DNA primase